MATILEQLESALGQDKFRVLASGVDSLWDEVRHLRGEVSVDEEIKTLELDELAEEYGAVNPETLRKQICAAVGKKAVFKLGSKWVIRKRKFLEFLKAKEQAV